MKRFAAVSLAALMVLAVFASCASAADSVEIRSSVYTNTTIDAGDITIGSADFAGFYYDLDDDLTSETLKIISDKVDDRTIDDEGLEYTCAVVNTSYDYELDDWAGEEFPLIGFFAEDFVPLNAIGDDLWDCNPDKLAKLILDDDEKYTLRTGELLDIGQGYTLEAKQVDVDGAKVWLEFAKDGEFIDDEIIEVATQNTWIVDLDDIEDEDDVVVLRVHVNQVFQGAVDSIAQIEGLWLIDYENAFTIESDDEFGEFEVQGINSGTGADFLGSLVLRNDNTVTLTKDSDQDLGNDLAFKVADSSQLRFYLMKEFTEPGTYEIRGSIATGDDIWNYADFAGFYYDLDDDVYSETLEINTSGRLDGDDRLIDDEELTYTAEIIAVDFEYTGDTEWEEGIDQYGVIGFFAEEYVPLMAIGDDLWDSNPDKLAKLLIDDDEKYTLRTGELLDLADGYTLEAKQVDVDGEKVWLEFSKDGEYIDDEIIEVATQNTWEVDLDDIEDEDDVVVLRVHVNQVFQGAVDSIAQIEGLWLIDYENAMTIESDDTFGELEVQEINSGTGADFLGSLVLRNDNTITLTKDSDETIAEGMYFKIADDNTLRFYPFVERTIEGAEEEAPVDDEPVDEEPVVDEPVDDGNETVEEPVVDEPVDEEPVDEEPVDDGEEEEPTPGFGFAFGLVGLLAVVYLVRRNN